jgi:hypothetical protein
MKTTNPVTKAQGRYFVELGVAMALYLILLVISIRLLERGLHGPLMYLVAVVPMLAIVGVLAAVVRFIAASDEFMRQTMMISLALAGGLTMTFVLTCGFLENAGLPRPSTWLIWLVYAGTWGISAPLIRRCYE